MGLVQDYLSRAPQLEPFYERHPGELFTAPPGPGPWAPGIVEALCNYQETLGYPKDVDPAAHVIATGQQPGLFGGPLYTVYKAITALQLAERYSKVHGVPCVPLFWVASDDHDFEEVCTAHLLTKQYELLSLKYDAPERVADAPMYLTPVDASIHALIDEAAARCSGEYRDEIAAWLHDTLDAAQSMSHFFALLLARLFRDTPLVIFAPNLGEAREVSTPVFESVAKPLEATRLSNAAAARLKDLGYPPQVVKAENECSFFVEMNGSRCKVLWEDGEYKLPTIGRSFTQGEMLALLASPNRFSANVVLRPVLQQALFPVAAYVGGPGEIAYWLQFREVFAAFGQKMPVVYPRLQAVLLDSKTRKLRDKFAFAPEEWTSPLESLESRAVLSHVQSPALAALRAERGQVAAALEQLAGAVRRASGKNPAPAERTEAFVQRTLQGLDRLEAGLAEGDTAQADAVRAQVRRVAAVLAPLRKPQERVFCVLPWLFQHGWDLIPRLMQQLDATSGQVQEIEL